MDTRHRPYWFWPFDRWNLLVAVLLALLLLLMGLSGRGAPQIVTPTFTAPAPGATLMAGQAADLSGTAAPNAQVRVFEGDKLLGETKADASGQWRLALPALSPGAHVLTAQVSDPQGKTLATSQPLSFAVSEPQPVVPTITGPAEGMTLAADVPVVLTGTGTPGTTVKLYDGAKAVGEATVGADGQWKLTLSALAAGVHSLIAKVIGADGKELAVSQPVSLEIPAATSVPAISVPVISPPDAEALTVLQGTAAPRVQIKLYDGDKVIGEATADKDGAWKLELPALAAGTHSLTAVAYGPDGKEQASSKPLVLTIPEASVAPGTGATSESTIGWPPDRSTVASSRPLVTGRAFPRGVVRIYDGGALLGETVVDANGNWSFRPQVPLAAGQHALTVVATSPEGQVAPPTQPVTFTVLAKATALPVQKATGVATPTFTSPADGDTVDSAQPLFAGTATPKSVVRLYDGGTVIGQAVADSDGRWSFRPTEPLAEGDHAISAVPLNADGTEAAVKSLLKLTVASGLGTAPAQPPVITSSLPATLSNSRPVVAGKAAPGATIRVYDGDQLLGEVKAGPDGSWYFLPATRLAPGAHVLRFETVDSAGGRTSFATLPLTIVEGVKPIEPPKFSDLVKGQVVPGEVLRGTAPSGSQVKIYDGDVLLGTAMAGADGAWRFRLPKDLPTGKHELRLVVVDRSNKVATQSVSKTVEVAPPMTLPVTGAARIGRQAGRQ